MADELAELRQRVAMLEERLNSESGLRAKMDPDQASLTVRLDAQDNLLRALSITQSDHTGRLTRLEAAIRRMDDTIRRVEGVVGHVQEGIQAILSLLQDRR